MRPYSIAVAPDSLRMNWEKSFTGLLLDLRQNRLALQRPAVDANMTTTSKRGINAISHTRAMPRQSQHFGLVKYLSYAAAPAIGQNSAFSRRLSQHIEIVE
jgi:hypothetical protein